MLTEGVVSAKGVVDPGIGVVVSGKGVLVPGGKEESVDPGSDVEVTGTKVVVSGKEVVVPGKGFVDPGGEVVPPGKETKGVPRGWATRWGEVVSWMEGCDDKV